MKRDDMSTRSFGDEDIHAYVDGRLDATRRAEFEVWLQEHPEVAARAAFYARLNEILHRRFDNLLDAPIPRAMLPARRFASRPRAAALAVVGFVAGLTVGWLTLQIPSEPPVAPPAESMGRSIATQAAVAHATYAVEIRRPVEIHANQEEILTRWLSKRMGREIKAPSLDAKGYRLIGGRLLPGGEELPAAQFMYENAAGARVTLFVHMCDQDQGEAAFQVSRERNGVNVIYWLDRTIGYALSGNQPVEQLVAMARDVYERLEGA